jgi:hypothetical protein
MVGVTSLYERHRQSLLRVAHLQQLAADFLTLRAIDDPRYKSVDDTTTKIVVRPAAGRTNT